MPQQLGTNAKEGVLHLQRYLDYAISGPKSLAVNLTDSIGDVESPLEAHVLQTIRSWGTRPSLKLAPLGTASTSG